ncbi:cytochrome c oxidase subunit NDUFA4L [Etheostoma spectabile]|uniref:cytochrome c oxidase subunit NDUFA4L n=1 Tax=Etheostoma spectabile TaxID=54343 RepID=UPI0013AFA3EF|nr:cytochrome c oxidase subunit NDUFA4-like [Etheostoma spectabile]
MLATMRKQLRSHPALIPLLFFISGGAAMSMMYLARLAIRNPDVSWDRKNNPEPWNKMAPTDQYKFYAVNLDYSKLKKQGPDF